MKRLLFVAALASAAPALPLRSAQSAALKIVVIAGEDAVNVIQQKTAVAPVVEVRDRNDLPVAGAIVTFSVTGKGATFGPSAQAFTIATDSAGRAVATGFTPVASGPVQINVQASYQGQAAATTITQTNVLTVTQAAAAAGSTAASAGSASAGAGGGLSGGAIAGIVGAGVGAAALGVKALNGTTPPSPVTVTGPAKVTAAARPDPSSPTTDASLSNPDGGCAGVMTKWPFQWMLTETAGVQVTFSGSDTTIDGPGGFTFSQGFNAVVGRNSVLFFAPGVYCGGGNAGFQASGHNATRVFYGVDEFGNAIVVEGTMRLLPP